MQPDERGLQERRGDREGEGCGFAAGSSCSDDDGGERGES